MQYLDITKYSLGFSLGYSLRTLFSNWYNTYSLGYSLGRNFRPTKQRKCTDYYTIIAFYLESEKLRKYAFGHHPVEERPLTLQGQKKGRSEVKVQG